MFALFGTRRPRLVGAQERVEQLEHNLAGARNEASEARGPNLDLMTRAELLKVAEERSVAVPKSANKAGIIKTLAA